MLLCIYLYVLPGITCWAQVLQGLPPGGEEIWGVRQTGGPTSLQLERAGLPNTDGRGLGLQ